MVFGDILKTKLYRFFFARNRFKSIYSRHIIGEGKPVDEKRQEELSIVLDSILEDISIVHDVNYQLLEAAIDKALSNGNRVILADSPTNPLFENQLEAFTPRYNKLIQKLIQGKSLGYLDLRDAVDWKPEDFRDLHHMLPSGGEKHTAMFAKKLVQLNL